MTDDRYKKAWEELRLYILAELIGHHAAMPSSISALSFDVLTRVESKMNLLIPPSRVYDPAVEWVPVSSGQMPEAEAWYQLNYGYPPNGEVRTVYVTKSEVQRRWFDTITDCQVSAWRNMPAPYRGEG